MEKYKYLGGYEHINNSFRVGQIYEARIVEKYHILTSYNMYHIFGECGEFNQHGFCLHIISIDLDKYFELIIK